MRVFVKVYSSVGGDSKTYAIPCKDGTQTVGVLKEEVLTRCGLSASSPGAEVRPFQLSLAVSEAILSESDAIEDVLQDGDFLCLGTCIHAHTQ